MIYRSVVAELGTGFTAVSFKDITFEYPVSKSTYLRAINTFISEGKLLRSIKGNTTYYKVKEVPIIQLTKFQKFKLAR